MKDIDWQWIVVAMAVLVAAVGLWRMLRKDPCSGCSLADACEKKKRHRRHKTRDKDCRTDSKS